MPFPGFSLLPTFRRDVKRCVNSEIRAVLHPGEETMSCGGSILPSTVPILSDLRDVKRCGNSEIGDVSHPGEETMSCGGSALPPAVTRLSDLSIKTENKHARTILENLRTLSLRTKNVRFLLNRLAEKGECSRQVIRDIMGAGEEGQESVVARRMYEFVMRSGQEVFQTLYDAVWESGQRDVAMLLKPRVFMKGGCFSDGSDDEEENEGYVPLEKFRVRVKKAILRPQVNDVIYKMSSCPKGYAFILDLRLEVNHEKTLLDKESNDLRELFTGLDYEVELYTHLRLDEIKRLVLRFRDRPEHAAVDSCVVVLLGDGYKKSMWRSGLYLSDSFEEGWLNTDWVLEQFSDNSCPSLKRKPKLFVFQSTSGYHFNDKCINESNNILAAKGSVRITDAMIAYASYSECTFGRGLSHEICNVFMKRAHDTELRNLLREVSKEMNNVYFMDTGPIPLSFESCGFDGQFYFNPGLFDN